jgi:hypothetical protein
MWIQCFITKFDGSDVFVDFEGVRYIFTKNAIGNAVCFVGNGAHVRRLLKMGPGAYAEYVVPKELQSGQPGAEPVPLGGKPERRDPEAREPLPDALSVDEALTSGGQVESAPVDAAPIKVEADGFEADGPEVATGALNPTAAEGVAKAAAEDAGKELEDTAEVQWTPEAVKIKINEFQGLNKPNFKSFVDANHGAIMEWPKSVRSAVAKKLFKNFPDLDPGIEGFVINDYLVNDTGDS